MTTKKETLAYITDDAVRKEMYEKLKKDIMKKVSEIKTFLPLKHAPSSTACTIQSPRLAIAAWAQVVLTRRWAENGEPGKLHPPADQEEQGRRNCLTQVLH